MKRIAICALAFAAMAAGADVPKDLSNVRGFNYASSSVRGHTETWTKYNAVEVERDLGYAQRLNFNQVRVFITYEAWTADKEAFRKNLVHFVRAAHQRGMGVMPTIGSMPREALQADDGLPLAREWVQDLVKTIGTEPGLAFWDATNEPDYPPTPAERMKRRMELAKDMAGFFHEFDKKTPVTIGYALVPGMEEGADAVDVLSFHDYSPSRAIIRANIARAKAFAAKAGKPVFNTEIGCVARSNPYDVTIQEHMNANVGWYIWELMITPAWGDVHGVFYPDGTVRDPSIAAAVLGLFRNRGPNVVLENPDREGAVTRAVASGKQWLAQPDAADPYGGSDGSGTTGPAGVARPAAEVHRPSGALPAEAVAGENDDARTNNPTSLYGCRASAAGDRCGRLGESARAVWTPSLRAPAPLARDGSLRVHPLQPEHVYR